MPNVLIIHHVEPIWKNGFKMEEDEYIEAIVNHVSENEYDKVIITSFEGDYYPELKRISDSLEDWTYGWEDPEEQPAWYEICKIDPNDIIRASGHEFTYVYPWIKELVGCEVTLMGGAQYECLADLCDSLHHLSIPYTKVKELIYG